MNKTKLLAALLSLALVFSACGGAASSESNVAHDHATHTEVTTEDKTEVAELATETVDNMDATEVDTETTETDATETVVAEKEDTKDTTNKSDAPNKDASNNSSNKDTTTGSNNTGNANTGSNGSGTNTGSNGSGASKPDSTEKDTEKPVTPEKDTEKPAPDTEKPVEDDVCKHTNVGYWGGGTSHDVICDDCFMTKDILVVLRTEPCDYSNGGVCKCGTACPHKSTTDFIEGTGKNDRCGYTCDACGFKIVRVHQIVWTGNEHMCTNCRTTWPCEHSGGARIFFITDEYGHIGECSICQAVLYDGPHTFVNGACSVCGRTEPVVETEAPAPEPTPEPTPDTGSEVEVPVTPVEEEGVTSVDVGMVWKRVCNKRHG